VLRRAYLSHSASALASHTRILVYGAGPAALVVGNTLKAADPNAHIVGYVAGPNEREPAVPLTEILGHEGTLPQIARKLAVDEIIVALTERRAGSMPLRQLLDCKVSGTKVYDLNTHFEKTLGQIRVDYLSASWLIFGDGFNQGALRTGIKRVFDIVSATLLCLLSAPVMLVAAVAIKCESPGPALYRQQRVGQNGRAFSIAKFRSMRTDAEQDGKPRWASANDNRVTKVGHIIRRLRIDELPQLFNVLRGDMSLVGPRPPLPTEVDRYTLTQARRLRVRPGMTGLWQVSGRSDLSWNESIRLDLYYVDNWSMIQDIVILTRTVGAVLSSRGAY
jgi:exopolysaccharide biosynthesis polyprenyl glycosylphosphotransferase